MYASQTKRLCVRGATSDDTSTLQLQQTLNQASLAQQQQISKQNNSSSSIVNCNQIVSPNETANMTASAQSLSSIDNGTSLAISSVHSPYHGGNIHESCNLTSDALGSSPSESTEYELINKLASETLEETQLELLLTIRNLVTACNKKKDLVVSHPNFRKIVHLIDDDKLSSTTKAQLILLICSVAKSGERNVKILIQLSVDEKIFKLMFIAKEQYLIEACLRCLRSILGWPKVSKIWLLYDSKYQPSLESTPIGNNISDKDSQAQRTVLERIISYARTSRSFIVQECIADIFGTTCCRLRDQTLLSRAKSLECIVQLLESSSDRVVIASLNWLTQMCLKNRTISAEIIALRCPSGLAILERLTNLMSMDQCSEFQFLSARCCAHIYKALTPVLNMNDTRIVNHVLPALIRMVNNNQPPHLRIKSAECIAYLIECEVQLQSTASICDHLIDSLASMLDYEHESIFYDSKLNHRPSLYQRAYINNTERDTSFSNQLHSLDTSKSLKDPSSEEYKAILSMELSQEMKRASFLALAALASNLETIRKKIFNSCSIMQHLVMGLTDNDTRILKSVLTCMLSLSRSVQQLRTSFTETSVYSALKNLLTTTSNDILILVLAILCNISLDFSPGKQHFLDTKTIDILCNYTKSHEPILKLHGVWVLMNMVYQMKDQSLKFQILKSLGINHILSLLEENDEELIIKTLGFLRNLLSHKLHIDAIMNNHGQQIMQSLLRILDKQCSNRIKEQCLCVLTNIADGIESKAFIMNNQALLAYLARTMCDEKIGDLRLAAICCITNLAHKEYDGSYERRDEMKKFGIEEKLKYMLDTSDSILSDRVRTAYNQFLISSDDKYVN